VSEYTKGPWELTDSSDFEVRSYDHKLIASIVMMEAQTYGNERRQQKANARLITAAPEMAEMLSDALRWLKGVHDIYGAEALGESKPMNCAGLDEMRDVLKKAGVLR
jgi:hypothetical protein